MLKVHIHGENTKSRSTIKLVLSITGVPYAKSPDYDLLIECGSQVFRQRMSPPTVQLLVAFLDALARDQQHVNYGL